MCVQTHYAAVYQKYLVFIYLGSINLRLDGGIMRKLGFFFWFHVNPTKENYTRSSTTLFRYLIHQNTQQRNILPHHTLLAQLKIFFGFGWKLKIHVVLTSPNIKKGSHTEKVLEMGRRSTRETDQLTDAEAKR